MTDNFSENITAYTETLLKLLNEFERAPKGLLQFWQETQQIEVHSVAKILLEESGFTPWFAYFLLKNAAENHSHFSGKADFRQLVATLTTLPVETLKALAAGVAGGVLPDLSIKLERLHEKTIKQLESSSLLQQSKKRRVGVDNTFANTPTTEVEREQASFDAISIVCDDEHVLVNASLTDTIRLFPPYLAGAIKRVPDPRNKNLLAAAIAMTFPNSPVTDKFGCQMALEITANKVEYIAKELFDVHLETTAGLRYVFLPAGAKVLPNPKSTLRGGQNDIIPSMFGTEVYSAIQAGPTYQDDIRQGHGRTDCVSMVISHGAHESAVIFVSLGPREGTLIREKLYN